MPATPVHQSEISIVTTIQSEIREEYLTYETALEDGSADVEQDHNEEGGEEEGVLPGVGVHPGHDQHRYEERGHQSQAAQQPDIESEPLTIHNVEDHEHGVGDVGADGEVGGELLLHHRLVAGVGHCVSELVVPVIIDCDEEVPGQQCGHTYRPVRS